MNLDDLKNRTILLLGKTRALDKEEFLSQLKQHNISCVSEYEPDVALIIEGRMLNPLEQDEMEALHQKNAAPFMPLSTLEKALCKEIDSTKLHMSLKLSSDEQRLLAFIKNEFITDELFLRLISLHNWKDENFFENDENRDVTAALISRFYKDIEKNHNVQYATTGLVHLIMQTDDMNLIETIAHLQPIKKFIKDEAVENGTLKILQMIALHPRTPSSVIKMYIKNATEFLKAQVATRDDLSKHFQENLYKEGSDLINQALVNSKNLDVSIAKKMVNDNLFIEKISQNTLLDDELFERLQRVYAQKLALNPSLTTAMVQELFDLNDEAVLVALASNENLPKALYLRLYNLNRDKIMHALAKNVATPPAFLVEFAQKEFLHEPLACNTATPSKVLEGLSLSTDENVLTALAQNTSTPVDILCQLQLDRRYDRYVKENESFGKHITQDNIGWL